MGYSVEEIKESIAYCGLVCELCNEGKSGKCRGCRKKDDGCVEKGSRCSIKSCAKSKEINGCWECREFPCNEEMFIGKRNRAFINCAKKEGVHKLAQYLKKNADSGIQYHKKDGIKGDYDILDSEEEILQLLKKREDPYVKCPVYETEQFIFRIVEKNDAEDLIKCYSDEAAAKFFNSDNCTSNFSYSSIEEMKNCISFWLDQYEQKYFVRFSIVDKKLKKAIGTIEFFARPETFELYGKVGVLRIDICSQYENQGYITEIINMVNDNFYNDFQVNSIITKAIPEAKERVEALINKDFKALEKNTIVPFDSFFIN